MSDNEGLEDIDGVGPTYADRLRDAGFETVEAVSNAEPEEVAEAAEAPGSNAERWIEKAAEMTDKSDGEKDGEKKASPTRKVQKPRNRKKLTKELKNKTVETTPMRLGTKEKTAETEPKRNRKRRTKRKTNLRRRKQSSPNLAFSTTTSPSSLLNCRV